MRRYFFSHLPIVLIYSLILIGLSVLGGADLKGVFWLSSLILFLGVLTGVYLLFLDRIVYTFSYPQEQLSQQFTWLWKQKKWGQAMQLLDARRSEQQKLTFRSAIFMVVWVFLAFFALTSTAGIFGKGVVMGLMLHILYDAWRLQRMDSGRLNTRLFWQLGRNFSHEEQLVFLWIITGTFIWLSTWVG